MSDDLTLSLDKHRQKIDKIDNQILELLEERFVHVHEIGKAKNATGGAIYRPDREEAIIERLSNHSKTLDSKMIRSVFLEVFSLARNMERQEFVGFLGPEGSYTHEVALECFGNSSQYRPIGDIASVFKSVTSNGCKYGVVPIENSSNGMVGDTIDSFSKYDVSIIAEYSLRVHHALANTSGDNAQIKKIYSKDIAFRQCKDFLNSCGLGQDKVQWVEISSTSEAARLASTEPNSAAICSARAARLHNLSIVQENIEDHDNNTTRFFVISDFYNASTKKDKTSVLVTLPNKPGILYKFLKSFYVKDIDLTKIKSHISGGITRFFIEFKGHRDDKKIQNTIKKYKKNIKFLGSYIRRFDDF